MYYLQHIACYITSKIITKAKHAHHNLFSAHTKIKQLFSLFKPVSTLSRLSSKILKHYGSLLSCRQTDSLSIPNYYRDDCCNVLERLAIFIFFASFTFLLASVTQERHCTPVFTITCNILFPTNLYPVTHLYSAANSAHVEHLIISNELTEIS